MKKEHVLFCIIFCSIWYLFSQNTIEFSFMNGHISSDDGHDFYEVDIVAKAVTIGTKIGTGMFIMEYSTSAFGTYIFSNENIQVFKGELLTNSGFPLYNLIVNDYKFNKVAITYDFISSYNWGNDLTDEFSVLCHLKIKIADRQNTTDLGFCSVLMQYQQFLADNYTTYRGVIATDVNIYHLYHPEAPINIIISIVDNQLTLGWEHIPECRYRIYSNDHFLNENGWVLEASDVLLNEWSTTIQSDTNMKYYYVIAEFIDE
jgi:hypothetical protein